jgi:hypothetical protein
MTATRVLGALALAVLQVASLAPATALAEAPGSARGQSPVASPEAAPSTGKKPDDGTPAKIVDSNLIESVLGQNVQSDTGENIGRIVDVLVDRSGQVRAAVIDFGGFLGLGTRKIAVDWAALHFGAKGKSSAITVEISRERLRVAPEVKAGEPVIIISANKSSSVPPRVEARS